MKMGTGEFRLLGTKLIITVQVYENEKVFEILPVPITF